MNNFDLISSFKDLGEELITNNSVSFVFYIQEQFRSRVSPCIIRRTFGIVSFRDYNQRMYFVPFV